MNEIDLRTSPVYVVTRRPPSAVAQDEDIYLSVPVAAPSLPDQVETIEIFLSIDFANRMIAQLVEAVQVATKHEISPTSYPCRVWTSGHKYPDA